MGITTLLLVYSKQRGNITHTFGDEYRFTVLVCVELANGCDRETGAPKDDIDRKLPQ